MMSAMASWEAKGFGAKSRVTSCPALSGTEGCPGSQNYHQESWSPHLPHTGLKCRLHFYLTWGLSANHLASQCLSYLYGKESKSN